MDPKAERRLILLILSAMLLLNVTVLALAPRVMDGVEPMDEDAFEPPADDEGDALEGFESGPPDDEKD